MKKWVEQNIVSSLSLSAIIGASLWIGAAEGRWFSTPESKYKTEDVIKDLDPIKLYGEYIIDSIEEVRTQEFRAMEAIKDSLQDLKLNRLDSLLRLNIFITDKKNKNIEHALEHIDH